MLIRWTENPDSGSCDKQQEIMDYSDQIGETRQSSRNNSQGEGTGQYTVSTFTRRADPSSYEEEVMKEKYGECQKNHAAAIGGNTRDGCWEFMPSGEEGTPEALKCAACDCHRNFHRKDIIPFHPFPLNCSVYRENDVNLSTIRKIPIGNGMGGGKMGAGRETKKRFRTKFTTEQKEKMLAFAEKADWKTHKLEDREVQQFCLETGIKKRVLKVWIHNNKSSREKSKLNTSAR